ncbi:hypothetical protein T439DRAFT_330366 [Meredithblackwellia eburnea MCA 4105]
MADLQATIAHESVVSGLAAMVAGMAYGTQVHDETFGPAILMLYVHSQLMVCGLHQLAGGILLFLPGLCSIKSTTALQVIRVGNVYANWVMFAFDIYGPLVGVSWDRVMKEAGLQPIPKDDPRLFAFTMGHYLPATLLLVSWIVLLYGSVSTKRSSVKKQN